VCTPACVYRDTYIPYAECIDRVCMNVFMRIHACVHTHSNLRGDKTSRECPVGGRLPGDSQRGPVEGGGTEMYVQVHTSSD